MNNWVKFIFGMTVFICSIKNAAAQSRSQFALGISGGYRLNAGCFFINYSLKQRIIFSNEYSLDKYQGVGIGVGVFFYPLQSEKFRPMIGATFTRTMGNKFSYGPDNSPTIFKVKDANFTTPLIGLKYDDIGDNKRFKNYFSYLIKVGYKISSSIHPDVTYVSGPSLPGRYAKISKYVNNSIVASLGLILNISHKMR